MAFVTFIKGENPGVPIEMIKTLKMKEYSQSTIKTYTCMFRMFFDYFHDKPLDDITEEDIRDYLIYSAGLRLSEVIHIRPNDIDSDRMTIHIRNAKGKKDRISLLSEKTLKLLREYYKEYRPKYWLFEGQLGEQFSPRSVQNILQAALRTTKIRKKVTVHTLRHSFATHLLETGVDLRYIQNFLGHESTKTTMIYTHITKKGIENIKSPLDNLDI